MSLVSSATSSAHVDGVGLLKGTGVGGQFPEGGEGERSILGRELGLFFEDEVVEGDDI